MAGKFELTSSDGTYAFHLKAGNGQVILRSQPYRTKGDAIKAVSSASRNGRNPGRFTKKTATDGSFYFTLEARNGQVIATSQSYATSGGRNNGIRSVMKHAGDASLVDLT